MDSGVRRNVQMARKLSNKIAFMGIFIIGVFIQSDLILRKDRVMLPATQATHEPTNVNWQVKQANAKATTGVCSFSVVSPKCIDANRYYNHCGTQCPRAIWVDAMVVADPDPDKHIMNVGCNKGNDMVVWMQRWSPMEFSVQRWIDLINIRANITMSHYVCPPDLKPITIGTNSGTDSKVGKPIGVCIEPMPANFALLRHGSTGLNYSFSVVQAAVGDSVGMVNFPDGEPGHESYFVHMGQPTARHVEVPMRTVDDIMRDLGLTRIDILTVDTEGWDPAVFRGASEALKSVRYLEFEVHRDLASTPWNKTSVCSVVSGLTNFNCYWAGSDGNLRSVLGCWQDFFEFGCWSNVVCAKKDDIWATTLSTFAKPI